MMDREDITACKRLINDLQELKMMSSEEIDRYCGQNQRRRRP